MFRDIEREGQAAFGMAWRVWAGRIVASLRAYRKRRRHRQELLVYFASDRRAAADIGLAPCEAHFWLEQPFWREQRTETDLDHCGMHRRSRD